MFKHLSLQFKLIFAFLILVVVLAGASFYQIRYIQRFNGLFVDLIDNDFVRLSVLDDVQLQSAQLRGATFEYQHRVFEGQKVDFAAERAKIVRLGGILRASEAQYHDLTTSTRAGATPQEMGQLKTAVSDVVDKALAVVDATGTSTNQHVPESQEEALITAQEELDNTTLHVITSEEQEVALSDHEVDGTVQHLQSAIVVLAASSTGLALVLGVVVSSWISNALNRIRKGAEFIANGDFSRPIPVKTGDEIGQLAAAFNSMSERLRDAYRRQAIAQQRDEAMLLSMGEGLIALDSEGRVALMNKTAAELFDLPSEAAGIGKLIQEVYQLYPANLTKMEQPIEQEKRPSHVALRQGVAVNEVYGFKKADGRKYLLNITANPVKLDGKVVGVITVLRDVTKEKEVDRMKTEFISLASHQLRTPLSAIKWFSEMLVSGDAGELQPDQLDFAKNIAESTERMIDLVNALLNISRIESGRIMVDPKPTDLKELVSGIVSDLKAKTEEKNQTLIISVNDGLPKINLDPRLIGQVYLNLLTNAVKYTPKGGEISVFISRKDDQIISQVTDNGYGIPKEQQGHIFQKFFRAANAVKVETDGTGLGLYLIKAVVESSGGKIWFESEEGKGTTFWFSMPLSGMQRREGEVTLDA
ncbi:MAG TPA: ATP-binding protein [Candidatus Saccharimonadales bacterium]